MRNKYLLLILLLLFPQSLIADNLNLKSSEIVIDKKSGTVNLRGDVVATDHKNNILKSNSAEYKKDIKYLYR